MSAHKTSGRLSAIAPGMLDGDDQLRELIQIGLALSRERNVWRLLDKILYESRRFTRAEAGTLYVREKDELCFRCVQNEAMPDHSVRADAKREGGGIRIPISRTSIAGYVAATGEVLNIADVYQIPEEVEYSFNDSFDRSSGYRTRSMLVVPMVEPEGGVIGVIQLINARDQQGAGATFPKHIEELVAALASQAAVALENANLTRELQRLSEEIIYRLSRAAEYRDTDTGQHIRRMSMYSAEIAKHLGFSEEEQDRLQLAAPLHDIGKIAVPDAILQKPGKLTPEEYVEMQRHTSYGGEILAGSDIPILDLSEQIARTHHEKWDGTGYPAKIQGKEIPLVGRIAAVADVFDALSSKRVYKEPMPIEEAVKRIREGSGTHFDPAVVEAFGRALEEILKIRDKYQ